MSSKEQQVADAFMARLAVITRANGYATDIGGRRFAGKINISPDDAPCSALAHGEDEPEQNKDPTAAADILQNARFHIEAHDRCDPDHPNVQALLMIADIKRALFEPAHERLDKLVAKLEYRGRTIQARAEGTDRVVVVVEVMARWREDLANP